ncbi:hypothetical protein PO002_46505, partial [Cupriavidus necator]|uniref:hypothetical protein n=1 Tax=Cupriavidus necator TaxID=106590 RepID=UPI0039C2BB99
MINYAGPYRLNHAAGCRRRRHPDESQAAAPEACALDPEALEQAQSDFRQLLKLAAKAQLSMAGWPCASPN